MGMWQQDVTVSVFHNDDARHAGHPPTNTSHSQQSPITPMAMSRNTSFDYNVWKIISNQ